MQPPCLAHSQLVSLLKNLAIRDEENKAQVGQLMIKRLLKILERTSSVSLQVAVLQCLYVLSLSRENCIVLHKHNVQSKLAPFKSPDATADTRKFALQIDGRMKKMAELASELMM